MLKWTTSVGVISCILGHAYHCLPAVKGRQQRRPANQTMDSSAGEETNDEKKVQQETDAARTSTPEACL